MIATQELPNTITPEQVEGFLSQHPDFFKDHLGLLEKMTIPHPSGQAVSLLTKQLELYRQRHQETESRLNNLIEIGKENDLSFKRMHELNLAMLEADSFEAVLNNLNKVLSNRFQADFVTLRIVTDNPAEGMKKIVVSPSHKGLAHFSQITQANKPICRRPTIAQARFLFRNSAMEVRSCAIIPMMFTDMEGLIGIGSRKEDRFHHSMGDLFLVQLSEVIGTRLISLIKQK